VLMTDHSQDASAGCAHYPGKSNFQMLPVSECIAKVLAEVPAELRTSRVPLDLALGHFLASDVVAQTPIPSFPVSIMDGFAVRTRDGPGRYPVDILDGATAGGPALAELQQGHVRYITTGAPLPDGADAVVMVEDTTQVWEGDRLFIEIGVSCKVGSNIRQVGSDTRAGELVLCKGTAVGAGELGIIAALGLTEVDVFRMPRVAVLSTGDELVDVSPSAGLDQRRGQIFDCNRPMLRGLIREAGAEPMDFGIVRDDVGALRGNFDAALADADIIVTSGGVSRGSKDHMKSLLAEMGAVHFGEMCMKPGKPTTFATVPATGPEARSKLVFALPGNPGSCFVTFKLLVLPAIYQLRGKPTGSAVFPRVDVELAQDVQMDPVRPEYHRAVARWEGGRMLADSTGFQRSSRVASVATANCLLELPARAGKLSKGTVVEALLIGHAAGCGGLSAEPGGYPRVASTPQEVAKAMDVAQPTSPPSAQLPSPMALTQRFGRVCVLVGDEEASKELAECLQRAGFTDGMVQRDVFPADIGAMRVVIEAWTAEDVPRTLVLILGHFGFGTQENAIVETIRSVVHCEAKSIGVEMLHAGLRRSPLLMCEQLVVGVRHQSLIVTVPSLAPGETLGALWPILPHLELQ